MVQKANEETPPAPHPSPRPPKGEGGGASNAGGGPCMCCCHWAMRVAMIMLRSDAMCMPMCKACVALVFVHKAQHHSTFQLCAQLHARL